MKKYFISVLIPYLLFHLSGCYSMKRVTKDEFSPAPDYPELIVRTNYKEYYFDEGSYKLDNTTIYGRGKSVLLKNPFKPFEGKISVNDVEDIQMNKSDNNSETSELLVKTKDREFIFKSEISNYSVKNDTIYGNGKCRWRKVNNSLESDVAININNVEEIQMERFNLATTIVLTSIVALSIVCIVLIAEGVSSSIW